ncbi:hypothetical protein RMCBS344292_08655 [Rhizopus microsporus]|nr:hypothetical protein RMCBS344292_08655 [Rhizopus microsporus]
MFCPHSDIGTPHHRDVEFTFENNISSRNEVMLGIILYIRQPKKLKPRQQSLDGYISGNYVPSKNDTTFYNKDRTPSSRPPPGPFTIPMEPSKLRPLNLISVASIVKKHMKAAGIDTKVYGPHSICSASSTKDAEVGNEIR